MKIIRTKPGATDFHLFENLVQNIYPQESIRHQQTDKLNLEYLVACFVLLDNDIPKARLALYHNPELKLEGKPAFTIGNFESINDARIASTLIDFVSEEAKKLGSTFLIGPMNGSTWDNYRFSLHHHAANFFLEPFHHLYYNELFQTAGFAPISHYSSNREIDLKFDYPDVLHREKALKDAGVIIRKIDLANFEQELEKLYPLVTAAFSDNFLYTPILWENFRDKYLQAKQLINPENVLIAENENKEIVGFIFCYDDLYNQKEKSLIIKTIARNAAEEYKGLGQVMGNHLIRSIVARNYKSIIHAFMIDTGVSTFASKKFHGAAYKKYVLYGKEI